MKYTYIHTYTNHQSRTQNSINKWANEQNRQFSKKHKWPINKWQKNVEHIWPSESNLY